MKSHLHFPTSKIFMFCFYLYVLILSGNLLKAQTCNSDISNPNAYGNGSWIGHVYDHTGSGNPVTTPFLTYKGFTTETEVFDRDWGTSKPTCAGGNDNFAVRYRMNKTFTPGNYTFTIGADDGVRLSIDGGITWILSDWSYHGYRTTSVRLPMSGNYNLVLEYYEKTGGARVLFNYTSVLNTDFSMPNSNTTSIITTCTGKLYDSGGAGGNYSNDEDRLVIINPATAGAMVRLSGTITAEGGYDYLTIYNGVGTGGAILWGGSKHGSGSQCGKFSVPIITSTAGPLTVKFHSDGNNTCSGFNLDISCFTSTPCSGTPIAGTALLSSATGAPSSAFVGTVSGSSVGSGLSYQWQIADASGGPYTNISGQTSAEANLTAVPLMATTKYYRRMITCGSNTSYSSEVSFTTTSPLYCTPVITNPKDLYMNTFQFVGTLNDNPGPNVSGASGYSDFTALTPVVMQPQGAVLNIVAGALGSNGLPNSGYWKAWVDYNRDGIFSPTELVYSLTSLSTESLTFGFVIPANTPIGKYRFRIRVGNTKTFDACTDLSSGETEDYFFEVVADCAAKINTAKLEDGSRCGTGTVKLTAESMETGTGTGVRWYAAPTGGNALHDGATFTTDVITENTSVTYYVVAYNSTCGESVFRIPVTAIANPGPAVNFGPVPSFCTPTTGGQIITATNGTRLDILLNEKFDSGLGKFQQSATESGYLDRPDTYWINKPSPYVPRSTTDNPPGPYEGLSPALSSGYTGGNFAMSNTDFNRLGELLNRMTLTNSLITTNFTNLKLDFDLYYFTLITAADLENYFSVDYSLDGGTTWINLPNVLNLPNPDPTKPNIYKNQGNPNIWKKVSVDLPPSVLNLTTFKVRFSSYSFGKTATTSFKESIAAIDNVKIYGTKDESSQFEWTSTLTGILYESTCTTKINATTKASAVCVKPDASQFENNKNFSITASASFSNGCPATGTIVIGNDSKIWNPTSGTDWSTDNWKPDTTPPTANKCVIIKKPVVLSNGNGLAKNITIESAGSLTIKKDRTLTVTDYIKNESTLLAPNEKNLVLETDGNLIQTNNGAANSGRMTAQRMVNGLRFNPGTAVDYVYWSSPVAGQKTKGTGGFSPGTPNNKFYYYLESNDYFYETGDLTFTLGRGYAVQAENNKGSMPFNRLFEFNGTPNNGDIGIPLAFTNEAHGYNLVGNPYPSNIRFEQLYAGNSNLIWNTAYFWTNNVYTADQMAQNYGGNNYAVYNGTGGNSATKAAGGSGNTVIPNGVIKVGQGFIVQAKMVGTLDFKNTYGLNRELRIGSTGTFFSKGMSEKNRFWIKLVSPTQLENSQLVGYVEGATDGFEQDYDAEAFDDYSDLFYSVIPGKKLLIQGKSSAFTEEDKVTLGANFFQNGSYTIALENAEGIFNGTQNIYLKDKQEGIITNLSQGSYTFSANKGDNASRFEIIYKPEIVLLTDNKVRNSVEVYRDSDDFVVRAVNKKITVIQVFDASGRLIYSVAPNSLQTVIPADKLLNSIYVLKINQGGIITTIKIIK